MTVYGITDKGTVRAENQDSLRFFIKEKEERIAAVLCDGMGGANGGRVASSLASDAFMAHAQEALTLSLYPELTVIGRESAAYANLKVFDASVRKEELRGMGTTLVAALVDKEQAVVVNIGDSRCYWIADEQIRQVTRDHSLVQQLLEQGTITEEEAASHPRKNVITRAVGTERTVRCDVFRIDLQKDDVLLLCSDGLSNTVSEAEMLQLISSEPDIPLCARKLLDTALARGAGDNVTVILLRR